MTNVSCVSAERERERLDQASTESEAPGIPGSALLEVLASVPGVQGVGNGSGRELSLEQSNGVVGHFSWLH